MTFVSSRPSALPTFAGISGTYTPETPPDHRLKERSTGYNAVSYAGKQEQFELVVAELEKQGKIPLRLCKAEAAFLYGKLGIDDLYFQTESVMTICSHVLALYGEFW